RPPPRPTRFPYTTLFRSGVPDEAEPPTPPQNDMFADAGSTELGMATEAAFDALVEVGPEAFEGAFALDAGESSHAESAPDHDDGASPAAPNSDHRRAADQ